MSGAANAAFAGQRLTAAMLRAVAPVAAYKSLSESVTSSTAMQNDDALLIPLLANATYHWKMTLYYTGGTRGGSDIKFQFGYPSGASGQYALTGVNTSGTLLAGNYQVLSGTPALGTNGSGNDVSAVLEGTIVTSGTAGNLQFQWAQNTSSSTPTTVLSGSDLLAWQVA